MAAPPASVPGTGDDGYRSEDEDRTIGQPEHFNPPAIEDRAVTHERDPALERSTWVQRDATNWQYYTPSFTRPGYDDNVEVAEDGTKQRPRRGGWWNSMRPAILPTDPDATQYAQRFGIHPDRIYNERGEARSMLTPVPPSNDNSTQWGVEQSFQAMVFRSFTTKELFDVGALDPTQTTPPPDLQGDLDQMLIRDKWSRRNMQESIRDRFWYNLNGERKSWAVEDNDELWAALQPSLQLVSKVLESGHPFWKAILSLYHLRPVPEEKDGRTDEAKASPDYRPYISVCYDIDRDQMYTSARELYDVGFDSEAAALEMLRILLRFSIVFDAGRVHGVTVPTLGERNLEDCKIQIDLNAAYIWPLLAPQYSESEKAALRFDLAKTILHELAHAARCAQVFIMGRADVFIRVRRRDDPWNPRDWHIYNTLRALFTEAGFGSMEEYVFQDNPQVEEGKSCEQQLWGWETFQLPEVPEGRATDVFRPVMTAKSWPWSHPKIHLQNKQSVDAGLYAEFTSRGYRTWLLDPPASAYDLVTPLPVNSFTKFMQQSWWDTDFVKFGHQGLKLPIHSTDSNRPLKTVATSSESINRFLPMLTMVIRSQTALEFVGYAMGTLFDHGYEAILQYLVLLTREAASASLLRNRLYYERRTWPRRLRGIIDYSDRSTASFNVVWSSVNQNLQGPFSDRTLVNLRQVSRDMREMLRNLTELRRLVGVEIQYAQGIASQYILKTPEERRKIHRRYMRLLRIHLRTIFDTVTETTDEIGSDHNSNGQVEWQTIFAPWEARLMYMMQTSMNPRNTDPPLRQEIQVATDAFADLRKATQQICSDLVRTVRHVDSVRQILGDEYIETPISTTQGPHFPGVPIARSMMEYSKALEVAAVQEIIGLNGNTGIDDIVRQWLRLLGAHVGLSDRVRGVQTQIWVARGKEDIRAITIILFQAKRDQNQPAGAAEAGQAAKDQQLATLRHQIRHIVRNNEVLTTYLREICDEEGTDGDGEADTIMSIPYVRQQQPPPQQPPQLPQPAPPQQPKA